MTGLEMNFPKTVSARSEFLRDSERVDSQSPFSEPGRKDIAAAER